MYKYYQKISDAPQIGTVAPQLIEERLDNDFFKPEYIESYDILLNCGYHLLELGDIAKLFTGPFGSKLPSSLYRESGIPLLRVQNVGEFEINKNNLVYLDTVDHEELSDSRLIIGDLALAKSGSFGNIVPIWSKYGECNITEHILGIRVKDGSIDNLYLAAFLTSKYGMNQIKQRAGGTLIKYLGVQTSRKINVLIPDERIQSHIGYKVRLAEKCREEAIISKILSYKLLHNTMQSIHENTDYLPQKSYKKLSYKPYCVSIQPDLISERLTAISYNNNFLDFTAIMDENDYVFDELKDHFEVSAMIGWKNLTTADYVDNGIKMLRCADIGKCYVLLDDAVQVFPDKVYEQPQIHLQQNDIVFSKDGTLGIAAVIPEMSELICAGSTLARIRKKTSIFNTYYACAYLNSEYTRAQISYYTSGIAQPHIIQEYIRQIKIPVLPDSIQNQISEAFQRYDFFSRLAYELVKQAKSDVEKLIESKLDTKSIISGRIKAPTWDEIKSNVIRETKNEN